MSDYEKLSQRPLGDNILAQISATARDIVAAMKEVLEAEEALKNAQARLRTLQEDTMPELMSEAGQEDLRTSDGIRVEINQVVRGTPSKENQPKAYQWLRDGGNGGIIKSEIKAALGKDSDKKAKEVLEVLQKLGVLAKATQSVHHQSLAAVVREKLAKGEEIPLDILGVQVFNRADVSFPK